MTITIDGPMLEGVLGWMTDEQAGAARAGVLAAGQRLDAVAKRLRGRIGWHGRGLEMHWMPSGQLSIWGSVEAGLDASRMVAFIVELRPSWYFGDRKGSPGWEIAVDVEADCQHSPDHGSMHTVFEWTRSATAVEESIACLSDATAVLDDLASRPLANWVAKGGR